MKAKDPDTEAEPPERVDAERAWPRVMALAVGQVVTVGVALFTVCVMAVEVEPL